MCKSKAKLKFFNQKISAIVDSIPDSFVIIDENLNSLFVNPVFLQMAKGKNAFEFFSKSRYHKRNYDHIDSNQIVADMKDAFLCPEVLQINFGIIMNDSDLIE